MENVTKKIIIEFIQNNKIELSSTHTKLCLPVINRIFKKMSAGINFSGIKVENSMICDGHHRFIASILANFPFERIPGNVTSATSAVRWESVTFEDADYNNIPIEKVVELLN